jgi:hypothetical protein
MHQTETAAAAFPDWLSQREGCAAPAYRCLVLDHMLPEEGKGHGAREDAAHEQIEVEQHEVLTMRRKAGESQALGVGMGVRDE